jgi:hypothetical protein
LFGHTVGGAAGAVSRITGAMGEHLFKLTVIFIVTQMALHLKFI